MIIEIASYKELAYNPYYFFEFSFRASVGKSPPILFENSGLVVIDGVTRQIIDDDLLAKEIDNHLREDYFLKTENKYKLTFREPKIHNFQEARELVLDYIIDKNTQYYTQNYGNRSYDKVFVPYRNIIRIIKSGFVHVPIGYTERHEADGRKYQDITLGSSGIKWKELAYCPECQKKFLISQAENCKLCGKQICTDCINEVGLIFKKKLCTPCLSRS